MRVYPGVAVIHPTHLDHRAAAAHLVSDRGDWNPENRNTDLYSYRGQGIAVMSARTAELRLQRGSDGTTIILVKHGCSGPLRRAAASLLALAMGSGGLLGRVDRTRGKRGCGNQGALVAGLNGSVGVADARWEI
jgi:hypothetical protein